MKKYLVIYVWVGSLLLTNGCISNKAIQEFTKTSIVATSHLPVVASDLSESCTRQNQYSAIRMGDFDPLKVRQEAEAKCADIQASEKSFIVANKVLIDYLQTLDKLAGDDIVVYDKNLDKLAASLGETKLLPIAKVNAVNKIVKFLGDATANGWRRKQLGKAIVRVNADLQILISTLATIITNDYLQLLQNEQLAAKNLYLGTIKENKKKEPVAILLLQQQWDKEYKSLEDRKRTVNAYGRILATIAQGHQVLFDNQTKLNKKEVKKEILEYTSKLVPLVGEIKDNF